MKNDKTKPQKLSRKTIKPTIIDQIVKDDKKLDVAAFTSSI